MVRSALSLLLVAGLVAAAPVRKAPADAASELEGKWVVQEATLFGGIDQAQFKDLVIVISWDRYSARTKPANEGRIKVDDKARPKRLEFEPQTIDGKPVTDRKKGRWVYELDGDELRMASFPDGEGGVPEKIDPADPKQMIWKAKRAKD